MAASYPSSVKSFTTKTDGVDTNAAGDINALQDEATAIEGGLLNGIAHTLKADANNTRDLGTTATKWKDLWLAGSLLLTGGQITFPATQNPSSDPNTLDDYKEASWTPVIGGSGGTSGQTYSSQFGIYRKIGSIVFAFFDVTLSAKGTITTNVQIQGLPVTVSAASTFVGMAAGLRYAALNTTWVNVHAMANGATTTAGVFGATVAAVANQNALTTADITNTTNLSGLLIYFA